MADHAPHLGYHLPGFEWLAEKTCCRKEDQCSANSIARHHDDLDRRPAFMHGVRKSQAVHAARHLDVGAHQRDVGPGFQDEANRIHPKVVRQALRLAFLSPGVASAILEGKQPASLSLARIPKLLPLGVDRTSVPTSLSFRIFRSVRLAVPSHQGSAASCYLRGLRFIIRTLTIGLN